jgi:DNA invertase Pin-like site-specific DNA recombinase
MALIGYARVSTQDQHLRLQLDALKSADCLKIFTDTISGAKQDRKGLEEALQFLRGNRSRSLVPVISMICIFTGSHILAIFAKIGIATY